MADILQIAYEVITPILLCVAAGAWYGRRFQPDPRALSQLSLFVLLPCLIFVSIAESDIDPADMGGLAGMTAFTCTTMALIGWLLVRRQRDLSPSTRSAFVLSIMLMNTGNFGLPFVAFAFGDVGVQRATVVFVTQALVTYTLGIYVASSGSASLRRGLWNIATNPLPYAAAAGLFVNTTGQTLPLPLDRAVYIFADGAVPLLLALLGVQLSQIRRVDMASLRMLALASGTRLLFTPVLVLAATALVGIGGLNRDLLVVQLSMPTAVNAIVLSNEFGSDVDFAAAMILVTTLLSVVTLSVLMVVVA